MHGCRPIVQSAFRAAVALPPAVPPVRVVCGAGQAAVVRGELTQLLAGAATPVVTETMPISEADTFDSFVGRTVPRSVTWSISA